MAAVDSLDTQATYGPLYFYIWSFKLCPCFTNFQLFNSSAVIPFCWLTEMCFCLDIRDSKPYNCRHDQRGRSSDRCWHKQSAGPSHREEQTGRGCGFWRQVWIVNVVVLPAWKSPVSRVSLGAFPLTWKLSNLKMAVENTPNGNSMYCKKKFIHLHEVIFWAIF